MENQCPPIAAPTAVKPDYRNPKSKVDRKRRLRSRFDPATMGCMNSARSTWQRGILLIGSIGPLGHSPASGTVTVAVAGLPLFWLMHNWQPLTYTIFVIVFAAVSVWIHQVGDKILESKDSRLLVWDELAGFFVAVAALPFTWQVALAAFLLERFFDILKIPPANLIEKRWPGGWGVVGDDLVAGLYTCGLMHLLISLKPAWFGLIG